MRHLVCGTTIVLLAASAALAHDDDVLWNPVGGSTDWMDTANWTDVAGGSDWAIPGWVSGNPYNDGSWASNSNKGRAIIAGATAALAPGNTPDGRVERIYVGSTTGGVLDISADVYAYKAWIAPGSSDFGTINHTDGHFEIQNRTYFGDNGAAVYNISGTAMMTVGDNAYWGGNDGASLIVNQSGGSVVFDGGDTYWSRGQGSYVEYNQTGGSLDVNRLKLGYEDTADAIYTISGGSLEVDNYVSLYHDSTFKVSGSDATSIVMPQLGMGRDAGRDITLAIELDADGSTLIEVDQGDTGYSDGADLENAYLAVDTLADFDGIVGDTYDILWSAQGVITTTGMVFQDLSPTADFDWAVVDDGSGGAFLRLTVVPEPMSLILLTICLVAARRRTA